MTTKTGKSKQVRVGIAGVAAVLAMMALRPALT